MDDEPQFSVRSMTRQECALHSLQVEFMRDADPDEWVALPGGCDEGLRIPDDDTFTGCWFSRPIEP